LEVVGLGIADAGSSAKSRNRRENPTAWHLEYVNADADCARVRGADRRDCGTCTHARRRLVEADEHDAVAEGWRAR
jgi:hypothetical protein